MKTLWRCCIRALKENKTRALVTILGVAMATAMITIISCLGSTALTTAIRYYGNVNGNAHETFYGVKKENLKYFLNNQSVEKVALNKVFGIGRMKEETQSRLDFLVKLCGAQGDWFPATAMELTSGRLPENEREIVLQKSIRSKMTEDVKPGDRIHLTMLDGGEKAFTVVGFFEKKNGDAVASYAYDGTDEQYFDAEERKSYVLYRAYTYWDGDVQTNGTYDVAMRYTKNGLYNRHELTRSILGISEELYAKKYQNTYYPMLSPEESKQYHARIERHERNESLEGLESLSPFHLSQTTVWILSFSEVIFLIFVLAGVFCINNSFDLSITERIRFFGMISSIGTTKRQRRMIVWMEAFVIGIIGIPIGILLGVFFGRGLTALVDQAAHKYLEGVGIVIVYDVAWWGILIAALQAILMIALSSMEAALRASKISPIEAIRSNETVKSKGKVKKTPKLIKKTFGIGGAVAWQNFMRAKIKYRATITSIAVSSALVIGLSCLAMLFDFLELELNSQTKYQVSVTDYSNNGFKNMLEIAKWPEVKAGTVESDRMQVVEEGEDPEDNFAKVVCFIYALDEESFEKLCTDNGVDPKKAKGKGLASEKLEEFEEGMVLSGVNQYGGEKRGQAGEPVSVELAGRYDPKTKINETLNDRYVEVYVGESWAKDHWHQFLGWGNGFFVADDSEAFVRKVNELDLPDVTIINYDVIYQMMKFWQDLISIMSAAFIALIVLIGVTNVINAVNFNMELRAPEFAKICAIGMTKKQFRKMIYMEGVFIGTKGLIIGLTVGTLIHYGIYYYVASTADMLWEEPEKAFNYAYQPPVLQIFLCILSVAGLLYLVLNHHVRRSQKRNVIETIRNENL